MIVKVTEQPVVLPKTTLFDILRVVLLYTFIALLLGGLLYWSHRESKTSNTQSESLQLLEDDPALSPLPGY